MDWTERINNVMDYVELHLNDSISENEVSKIAASPYPVFQANTGINRQMHSE